MKTRNDDGSALVLVVGAVGVLLLLVAVSFAVAQRSLQTADQAPNTRGALAAAEAGMDDFLFRLNGDEAYYEYGPSNLPPDGNEAFTSFVPIPGGETVENPEQIGEFTYEVDDSQYALTGNILVRSTGCAPGPCDPDNRTPNQEFRTIEGYLRVNGFLEFVYFTDYETLPPMSVDDPQRRAWREANCNRHYFEGRSRSCINIMFASDVIDGPFHTNDTFHVGGRPEWTSAASSAAPNGYEYVISGGQPTFHKGLQHAGSVNMPPTNTELKREADRSLDSTAEGCLYTGPTSIVLHNDETYTVESPYTRTSGPSCGTWNDGYNEGPQTLPLPSNGVIYVQNVPIGSPSDPNAGTSGCPAGNGNGLGYPYTNASGQTDASEYPYECTAGDVFVEGEFDGRLTIGAENNVFITDDVVYENADNDMLGLIPNGMIWVYHPVTSGTVWGVVGYDYYGRPIYGYKSGYADMGLGPRHPDELPTDRTIHAALLSLEQGFMVQNYDKGEELGTLTVFGAIAQRYRGTVGTSSGTGYDKNYVYDERFVYQNPPSFINPADAQWRIGSYSEQLGTN